MKIFSAQLKGTTVVVEGATASLTGSFTGSIAGIDINSTNTFTASTIARLNSIETISSSNDGRVGNIELFTSSTSARLNSIETISASNIGRLNALEAKTGSLATTGSNTFIGTQTITGSLYISSDLIVQGSSSLQNITASAVSIGTNIINLNTANPAIRYAGLSIGDSGSVGGSGSFLYDSVQDEMIFIHRGANTTVTSSVVLMGPQTFDNIGGETYPTLNIIQKGTGNEHLIDSCIFDNGTTVCIKNNLVGTGTACFASNVCAPTIVINNTNPILYINSGNNETATIGFTQGAVTGYGGFIKVGTGLGDRSMTFGLSAAGTNNDACTLLRLDDSGVVCFNNAICAPRAELTSDASCVPLRLINGVITGGSTTGVTALYFGDAGSGVSMLQREKYTTNQANLVLYSEYGYNIQSINACLGYNGVAFYTAGVKRQNIDVDGVTCFSSTVCTPSLIANTLTLSTATSNYAATITNVQDSSQGLLIRATDNDTSLYLLNLQSSPGAVCQSWVDRFVVTKGGNVGIGTSIPNIYGLNFTKQVTISNTDTSQYANFSVAGGSGASGGIDFGNQTVRHAGVYGLDGSNLGFYTNGTNSGNGLNERIRITSAGIACFACQICTPVLRASRVISNSTQIYDGDFSLNAGNTRSVVLCGGIYTLGDFHLMTYGNAGTGMSTIRLSTAGYFANTSLLQFCELQRYTFGSMTISGVSNNGTSISFNIGNCSGGSNGTGFFRMISLNGDAENNCIRVFIL